MPGWSEIMDTVQQQKQEMIPAFLIYLIDIRFFYAIMNLGENVWAFGFGLFLQ